jgi:hypothetical protein
MKIQTIPTYQGHYVPDKAYRVGPIFDADVLRQNPIDVNFDLGPEGETPFPPGATVLNNMSGIRYFRCTNCSEIVAESMLDGHVCEDVDA